MTQIAWTNNSIEIKGKVKTVRKLTEALAQYYGRLPVKDFLFLINIGR